MRPMCRTLLAGLICCGLAGCDTRQSPAAPAPSAAAIERPGQAEAIERPRPAEIGPDASAPDGASESAAAPAERTDSDPNPAAERGGSRDAAAESKGATQPDAVVHRRRRRTTATGQFQERTFDDLQFEMEKDGAYDRDMLTPEVEQIFGKHIRIRGFILPTIQQRGLEQFVLVRDNQECCFGPGAALYDCIVVEMEAGKTAEFSVLPVTVEGVFGYDEIPGFPELGPRPLAIYKLQASDVR